MQSNPTLALRILRKIRVGEGGCWEWLGAKQSGGYGVIGVAQGQTVSTHRASYEAFVGPIPEGLHLDHLCRNRGCCNPDHLEAVTQAENNRRSKAVRWTSQTKCVNGHAKTLGNTAFYKNGKRECRECRRLRAERRRLTAGARP